MKKNTTNRLIYKLNFAGRKRKELFLTIPEEKRGHILLQVSKHIQFDILSSLENKQIVSIVNELDPDEATDLIQLLPKHRQNKIIQEFKDELKQAVKILNQFDPKTAAGLMNLDYIQVDAKEKILDVAKKFSVHEKRTGRLPAILVLESEKLIGYLPGHELGLAKHTDSIKKHLRNIPSIHYNAPQDEVVHLFRSHPHNKVVVLDKQQNILGVIYSDDVLKALKEDESASLYDFAGVHDEESVTDTIKQKVKNRYRWLIINLGTAFLASFTVGLFYDVLSKYVLLAVYMPIVAGMGGNAGTQTLAVMVRGIALGQIDFKTAWPTLKREVMAGVINGLINGLLVAAIVLFINKDLKVALVLAFAMITNLFVAAFFGTLVPLIMKKLGKDPATSATIFITTATDVLGFLAFLGLATIVLK